MLPFLINIQFRSNCDFKKRVMENVLVCLFLATFFVSSSLCACSYDSKTGTSTCDTYTQWNESEDGAVSWAKDCDFTGHSSVRIDGPENGCGKLCLDDKQCTHFTWSKGFCYLKSNFRQKAEEPSKSTGDICGYMTARTDFIRVGK